MNLGEMRTLLRASTFDRYGDIHDDARCLLFLNAALQHIANWADALDQGLFFRTGPTRQINRNDDETLVPFYGTSGLIGALNTAVYRFRRPLLVERTDYGAQSKEVQPLQLVDYENRFAARPESDSELPPCYIFGENLHLLRPVNQIDIRMRYVYSLPDLVADADTPGQSNGSGDANALPVEYHPLIVSYATVLALSGQNADASQARAIYQEQRDELGATLARRRGARTGGRP